LKQGDFLSLLLFTFALEYTRGSQTSIAWAPSKKFHKRRPYTGKIQINTPDIRFSYWTTYFFNFSWRQNVLLIVRSQYRYWVMYNSSANQSAYQNIYFTSHSYLTLQILVVNICPSCFNNQYLCILYLWVSYVSHRKQRLLT
jgi:hypothetical protein